MPRRKKVEDELRQFHKATLIILSSICMFVFVCAISELFA